MTVGPYRSSARPAQVVVRCCGLCDQSVGGCPYRVTFQVSAWSSVRKVNQNGRRNSLVGDDLPAGISERAPQGTQPLVSDDGRATWREEGAA